MGFQNFEIIPLYFNLFNNYFLQLRDNICKINVEIKFFNISLYFEKKNTNIYIYILNIWKRKEEEEKVVDLVNTLFFSLKMNDVTWLTWLLRNKTYRYQILHKALWYYINNIYIYIRHFLMNGHYLNFWYIFKEAYFVIIFICKIFWNSLWSFYRLVYSETQYFSIKILSNVNLLVF